MSEPQPIGRRPSLLWVQGLACGAVATLATPTAILAAILLAPTLAAFLLDRESGKPVGRTVFLFGVAAIVQPMLTLWQTSHTVDMALDLATDTRCLVIAWAAQATGWLLSQTVPLFVQLALDSAAATRMATLRRARARTEEEWDLPESATMPPKQ